MFQPQSFSLKVSFLGLILVADQMLLPMFHVGQIPYKISYFLLALWAVSRLVTKRTIFFDFKKKRDIIRFSLAIIGIVLCALLGELALAMSHPVMSYGETVKNILMYFLVALAFGFGLDSKLFNLKWLIPIFYVAVILNLGV